jgi:hypothetical protein
MTHLPGHIICGGLGKFLRWALIWIKDHEFLNVAVHLKPEALVAAGWSEADARRFGEKINRDIHEWYEIGKRKGLEAHYYLPFEGNPLPVPFDDPHEHESDDY